MVVLRIFVISVSLATNGITSRQGRIMKGTIMAGQEGGYRTTNANLTVIKVDKENNYLLIKGNVPGPKKGFVDGSHRKNF